MRFGVMVLSMAMAPACSGTSGPNPAPYAGDYDTAVTLLENSCGAITIQQNHTIVAHTAGASTLTLTHAGNTYSGTVQTGGAFSTTPRVLGPAGNTSTVTISGTFAGNTLDAQVTVDVVQPAQPTTCQYKVRWMGNRPG